MSATLRQSFVGCALGQLLARSYPWGCLCSVCGLLLWIPRWTFCPSACAVLQGRLRCVSPATCMSQPSEDSDTVELSLEFSGLSISVRGSPSSSAAFVRGLSDHPLARSSSSLASPGPRPTPSYQASPVETRVSIQDSFENLPEIWTNFAVANLGVPLAEAHNRARRAGRAGQRARAVLRSPHLSSPRVFGSFAAFRQAVGTLEGTSAICHAFPSQTEAKIYFAGAEVEFPG